VHTALIGPVFLFPPAVFFFEESPFPLLLIPSPQESMKVGFKAGSGPIRLWPYFLLLFFWSTVLVPLLALPIGSVDRERRFPDRGPQFTSLPRFHPSMLPPLPLCSMNSFDGFRASAPLSPFCASSSSLNLPPVVFLLPENRVSFRGKPQFFLFLHPYLLGQIGFLSLHDARVNRPSYWFLHADDTAFLAHEDCIFPLPPARDFLFATVFLYLSGFPVISIRGK